MKVVYFIYSQDCVSKFDADPHKYGHLHEHEHGKGHDGHS